MLYLCTAIIGSFHTYVYHTLCNFVNSLFAAYYIGSFSKGIGVVGVRAPGCN